MGDGTTIRHAGRYWYFVDNLVPDEGAVVRLWVALPRNRPGQAVTLGQLEPEPERIHEDPLTGNLVACFEVRDPPADGPLVFTVDFEVVANEVRTQVDPGAVTAYDRESPEYARFTRSEPWIEITDEIAVAAREVVGEEGNPYLGARRIFDWVVREMSYEYPDMEDRGAAKSIVRRKGDCGEFSAVFVAMCRSVGIPARTVTCNWFTGSGHQWAEFLCPPYGWIPVDASVAERISSGEEGSTSARSA
jgi:transglutaminase-like putative cysteine protease